MQKHTITLTSPQGKESTIQCAEDQYILDAAEEAGLTLPCSCRAGACSTCTAKMQNGTIDNSEQKYLTEDQVKEGYALICVAYPKSECKILTHQQDSL